MEIIIIGALALWFYTLHRGRLFVRAYMFLMGMTEHGMDESSANYLAQDIGYPDSTHFSHSIRRFYGLKPRSIFIGSRDLAIYRSDASIELGLRSGRS